MPPPHRYNNITTTSQFHTASHLMAIETWRGTPSNTSENLGQKLPLNYGKVREFLFNGKK